MTETAGVVTKDKMINIFLRKIVCVCVSASDMKIGTQLIRRYFGKKDFRRLNIENSNR